MGDRDLGQRILNLLSSGSKKQESSAKIATALRVPKKALNTELYKLQKTGRVIKVQESPPMWCLASEIKEVSLSPGSLSPGASVQTENESAAHGSSKVDGELMEKVMKYLQEKQAPMKALDIAKALGLKKAADVNPTIYRLEKKNVVRKLSGKPPKWGLVPGYDQNEPIDGEPLEFEAGGATAATLMCRPEFVDDQPRTVEGMPIFQETALFQAEDYDSDIADIAAIIKPISDTEVKMEVESNTNHDYQSYNISTVSEEGNSQSEGNTIHEGDVEVESNSNHDDQSYNVSTVSEEGNSQSEGNTTNEGDVSTGESESKPKTFRDMFNLDESMLNDESDDSINEDIREKFMENYRKQSHDSDLQETGVSIPDSQCGSNNVDKKAELDQSAKSLTNSSVPSVSVQQLPASVAGLDKALSPDEAKACLAVLTALASLPGITNFVLKKKTSLTDEQLNKAMDKCLSLNYVSGSTRLWKITEAGQNLVNSHTGSTSASFDECSPAPVRKSIVQTKGPPPPPMAILKSQGLHGGAEKAPSSAGSSGLSLNTVIRTEPAHHVQSPPPLMSIQLESIPLLKTSSPAGFTNSVSVSSSFQSNQEAPSVRNSQRPAVFTTESAISNNRNQMNSSLLWDGFQNVDRQISSVSSSPSKGSSVTSPAQNFKQKELPGFKMRGFDQPPPKPEITEEYLNYPNQKTSHEVLKSIHRPSKSNAIDIGKSAFRKGPPPTPLELLTKGLKKTEISPPNSVEPPKTIYQQSTSLSSITNTSTFSRPEPPRPYIGTGSLLSQNQSWQAQKQPTSFQTGMSSFGSDPSFKSLPASASQLTRTSSAGNSLALSTESFAALNKNPVSALMEYAQTRKMTARIEVIRRTGSAHRPTFEMAAFVGNHKFPSITCHNKKEGRSEASDLALRQIVAQGQFRADTTAQSSISKTPSVSENMTHFDKVAALTHRGFTALVSQITAESFAGRKVIAGLVMKRSETDTGVLISLGTGNRCITGQQLSLQGNTINDSHAEIITRRGFLRFLYKQLMEYDPSKPSPLFERSSTGKIRVKSNITFHLYISTAPCGDGALFSPRDAEAAKVPLDTRVRPPHNPTFSSPVQGLLRTKVEGGEGTIPVEADFTTQTFDGIQRGERLRTMSCTDKICRWNVVGMQGALLSQFLDPVYLDSLTLGLLFDQGHLSRAVCCRVAYGPTDVDELLPQGFRLNHPWLGRVTVCDPPREIQKTKALSVNWSFGDTGPEVTDGTKGLCYTSIEKGFFSRCSKRNLFNSYKALCEKFGRTDLLQATNYSEAKKKAANFATAKKAMLEKFRENKLGKWVSKPVEEEMFGFEET